MSSEAITRNDLTAILNEVLPPPGTETNLNTITRITATVTTGSTGNIDTGYTNDGYTYIVAPLVAGSNAYLRAWVASGNNHWYLTAVNPNSGATINSTSLNIRYLVVTIKQI